MKITIVTPSFNQGAYIERTIQSVLRQTGNFDLEYWIIDGGSTDETQDILKKYAGKLHWVSEKDRGQAHAVNKGFERAGGEILGWLNSDDLYETGALQRVHRIFEEKPECQWVIGKCRIIDENDREIRQMITRYKNKRLSQYSYNRLLVEDFISQPAVFFKKSFQQAVGPLDETFHFAMDHELFLRMGARSQPVILQDDLASFRYYSHSKTHSRLPQALLESKRLCSRYAAGNPLIHFQGWLYRTKIRVAYNLLRLMRC